MRTEVLDWIQPKIRVSHNQIDAMTNHTCDLFYQDYDGMRACICGLRFKALLDFHNTSLLQKNGSLHSGAGMCYEIYQSTSLKGCNYGYFDSTQLTFLRPSLFESCCIEQWLSAFASVDLVKKNITAI